MLTRSYLSRDCQQNWLTLEKCKKTVLRRNSRTALLKPESLVEDLLRQSHSLAIALDC